MFVTSACNTNYEINNIGANILPQFVFVLANKGLTERHKCLSQVIASVTRSIKHRATMSQFCICSTDV